MTAPTDPRAARLEAARQMLRDLCHGRKRWTMSIPARPGTDSDIVIGDALCDAQKMLDEVASLTAQLADIQESEHGSAADDARWLREIAEDGTTDQYACLREIADRLERRAKFLAFVRDREAKAQVAREDAEWQLAAAREEKSALPLAAALDVCPGFPAWLRFCATGHRCDTPSCQIPHDARRLAEAIDSARASAAPRGGEGEG